MVLQKYKNIEYNFYTSLVKDTFKKYSNTDTDFKNI